MKQSIHLLIILIGKQFLTIISGVLLLSLTTLTTGCGQDEQQSLVLEVGMLLGSGGLGDRSFNDSAYNGLLEAQQKYNIRFETIDFVNNEENLETTRFLAQNNYDLIIGIGYEHKENLMQIANEFPDVKFAAIDFEAEGENIASIVYREQEGDFLIGVLTAMLTETKKVAVIGGMDIPAIQRIMAGFSQGVAYQDNNVEVITDFAGTFSDPKVGLERALMLYNQGVDVIHNAASRTGLGIIEAAKQTGKLTTGTSGDQRYMAPGNVVGNRPKRVDTAVMLVIGELNNGTFTTGIRSLGLKENGIMLGPFDESIVSDTILERLEDLKKKIIEGQIIIQAD
ncbi:MAG TPA: BMP family ABC transporter substrate-binding protein [Dehalococcoidia bacterium]|nr:BMP family ABC transporter substrate-binding protein [Dehalococcoidia bacterium]